MSKSSKKFVSIPPPKVVSGAGSRPPDEIFEQEDASSAVEEVVVLPSTESQENTIIEPPALKPKKPRSQKQLDHLARIREKSLKARQAKAEQKRRQITYAPPAAVAPAPPHTPAPREVSAPPAAQFVSVPQPVQNNYLSAEQIQTIVKDTMTNTLNDYSQKALARQNANEAENKKKHDLLVKQEVDLRQKKIQQSLLRRPRKGGRF